MKNKTKSLLLALVIASSPVLTFADTVSGVIIKNNTDANIDYKLDKDSVESTTNKVNVNSSYKEVIDDNNGRSVLENNQELSYLIKNNIVSRESSITFDANGISVQNTSPNLKSSIKKSDFLMGMYKAIEKPINSRPLSVNTISTREYNGGLQKIKTTTITPRGYSGNGKSFDYSEGDYQTFVSSNVTELYLAELLNESIITENELMPDVLNQIKARTSKTKPAWDNSFGAFYTNKYDDTNTIISNTSILGKGFNVSSYPKSNGVVKVTKNNNAQFFVDENIQTMDALRIIEDILRSKEENTSNLEVDQLLYKIIYKYGTYAIKYFDGVINVDEENKDSDRKTIAYLIYMGVLDFEEEGEFGNLYGNLTTEFAYKLLYRLHNKSSRKSLDTLKSQDFLTREEVRNYENGYVEQKVSLEDIGSVASSETISVTEGNHLNDTTVANAQSPSGEIQSMVKASNNSKTFTVVKMFIDTEQTRYQGTRIQNLESTDEYKVEDIAGGGRKVTFTINAGNDIAALACIDSRITITSNTSKKKGNITTLTQISDNNGKTANFISDKDLATEISDISIINSKTLINRKTKDKGIILADHKKALIGNTIIEGDDTAFLERINKRNYYNLEVVVPLMTNSYISSIDPAKIYTTVDLPSEELVNVEATSGNVIESVPVTKLGTSLGTDLNPLIDKTLDKYYFNVNLMTKGVSTLIKYIELGKKTKAQIIINWSYTLPSNADDIRDISEEDNKFSISDATKWLYRRPSSGTNGDTSLQDWWDNNIGLSNALANWMYGTEGEEYISSGYMTPSIDILVYRTVLDQEDLVKSIFKDIKFSDEYCTKFLKGNKDNMYSMLFNKTGDSLAAVRRLNMYETSEDANPKGIVSFSDRYVTYPTGAIYKAVDMDDRLQFVVSGDKRRVELNTRAYEGFDFSPNDYGNVKIYNPSNGSGQYVTMYYAGLSGTDHDGNYVRFTPQAGDEVSGEVYKLSDGTYSIKDSEGKDVIDSYTKEFLDVLPQGFVRQNIPANMKSFTAPVEEVVFGSLNDPDATTESQLGTKQQWNFNALSFNNNTNDNNNKTGNVDVDGEAVEVFDCKATGTQKIDVSGSKITVDNKTYTTNQKLTVESTAYTTASDESDGNGSTTASNTVPNIGTTIAVDPTVIPYGTLVYIPALNGIFRAEDTGKAVKGNKLDVLMDTKDVCKQWGKRTIDVYTLNETELPNSVTVDGKSHQLNSETESQGVKAYYVFNSFSTPLMATTKIDSDVSVKTNNSLVKETLSSDDTIQEYANYDVIKYYINNVKNKDVSSNKTNKKSENKSTTKSSTDKDETSTSNKSDISPSGSSVSSLDGFLFIGDSYIDGIESIVKSKYKNTKVYGVIGASAYAYNNDTKTFGKALRKNLPSNSDSINGVVVNIGVNNVTTTWSNPGDVKELLKYIKNKYKGKPIYVIKTTPVGTKYTEDSYTHTNKCISSLNKQIKSFCESNGINFIDATDGLVSNGTLKKQSSDGLHISSGSQYKFVSNIEKAIVKKSSNIANAPEDIQTVEMKTMVSASKSGALDGFVFIGDSYINRVTSQIEDSYSNTLIYGVDGATADDFNKNSSTPGKASLNNAPKDSDKVKGVVLNVGVNNVLKDDNVKDVKTFIDNVQKRYSGKPVYVVKTTPVGTQYTKVNYKKMNTAISKLNTEISKYCSSKDNLYFIDATKGLLNSDGTLAKQTQDGLHIDDKNQSTFLSNIESGINATKTSSNQSPSGNQSSNNNNNQSSNNNNNSNNSNQSSNNNQTSNSGDGTKVKTNHFSKAVGLTSAYYIIQGQVYKVKKTSTKYNITKVTDDSAIGETAYAFPVVYIKRNEVKFETLSNSTDDSKYKVLLQHQNLYLQDSNVFFSGLNNSLITRLLDQETGATTLSGLPSGANVIIGDMKFTKVDKILSSDPITDDNMVKAIYNGANNGKKPLEKEVLNLFAGLSITYSGRNSSEMAFTSFIKSAKLGRISNLADEQINNTMYESDSTIKIAKSKSDTKNMTSNDYPSSVVIAIATDDNILYRCIDEENKTYELVTTSDRYGEGYLDNVSKFYETLNLDDSDDLYEAMQTNTFMGSENIKYYINKIMKEYREDCLSDSLIIVKTILIIFISYVILLTWVLYPILGKNLGRQMLILVRDSFRTKSSNGLDLIKILTLGIFNVESKLEFRVVFICNIALFFILTLIFRSVGG